MGKEIYTGELLTNTVKEQAVATEVKDVVATPTAVRTVRKPRLVTSSGVAIGEINGQSGRSFAIEPGFSQALVAGRMWPTIQHQGGKDDWKRGVYNSTSDDYNFSFREILVDGSIADLIREREGALVIDLMAPSGTIADIFTELPHDPKRRGIAVSLTDERKHLERKRDEYLGVEQLAGDLTTTKTWRELEARMKGQKADLIIERGFHGLKYLPAHPQFYRYVMHNLWNMLSEDGGTMLLEIPEQKVMKTDIYGWERKLREQGIDFNIVDNTLRIVKHPDSPAELPRV